MANIAGDVIDKGVDIVASTAGTAIDMLEAAANAVEAEGNQIVKLAGKTKDMAVTEIREQAAILEDLMRQFAKGIGEIGQSD